ncbi:hypothetical protein F1188_16000 [Roseospira marina]|uniref:Uncharacterized protein n=1 Tax=Roseospira marina TaxID=140057 RepID=A0A5M6I871_9PROT|nr:hypothetical protein [Roseospira marina]KAA5604363.1 hypothetical protein F1188_16000 [Roseospira marina]MBB4315451.1 hypothetical protein [Roseospira marina]MBB5088403.1 hypothetical protein [Roseospira marina]
MSERKAKFTALYEVPTTFGWKEVRLIHLQLGSMDKAWEVAPRLGDILWPNKDASLLCMLRRHRQVEAIHEMFARSPCHRMAPHDVEMLTVADLSIAGKTKQRLRAAGLTKVLGRRRPQPAGSGRPRRSEAAEVGASR